MPSASVTIGSGEGVGEGVALSVGEGVGEGDALGVGETVGVALGDGDVDTDTDCAEDAAWPVAKAARGGGVVTVSCFLAPEEQAATRIVPMSARANQGVRGSRPLGLVTWTLRPAAPTPSSLRTFAAHTNRAFPDKRFRRSSSAAVPRRYRRVGLR